MTVKQIVFRGHVFNFNVLSDEEYSAMQRERDHIEKAVTYERHLLDCFSDKLLKNYTFATDDRGKPELTALAKDYVEQFSNYKKSGKGLLLYGTVGTGKTFISACIANALLKLGYSCYMTTFARISNEMQATFEKQDYIRQLMRYDLLIIDDLASERDTEYMNEIVISVIDERYRSGKPLIVTTNLTGYELQHPASVSKSRIYSRLFEMCKPYKVDGRDRRKEKLLASAKQKNEYIEKR